MAILVNLGQRGFVLKEGFLNPGETLTVDTDIATELVGMYPKELKVIHAEEAKEAKEAKEAVKEEVKVAEVKEPSVEEPKKSRGRKAKAK